MPGVKFGGKNCFDKKNCLFVFKTIHQNAAQVLLIMPSKTSLAIIVLYTNMAAVMSGANQESPKDHHREASNLNNEGYSVLQFYDLCKTITSCSCTNPTGKKSPTYTFLGQVASDSPIFV